MARAVLLATAAACMVAVWGTAAAQPAHPPLSLVTTYADGRVTEQLVGPNGLRAWTPLYPRVDGWRDAPGVPAVTALKLAANADGGSLRVTVSVLRGRAHEVEQPIAEAHVGLHDRVVIEDLRRVGLLPITLSVKPFAVPALHLPRMDSRVAGLVIEDVEPVVEPSPGYRITVRNRSDVPVTTLAFDAWAEGRPALAGQQGDPAAFPVVLPGATFTFRLDVGSARRKEQAFATATPLDDVVLTAAIWADGRLAGDPSRVAPLIALHRGRMAALPNVIAVLRTSPAGGDALTTLRQARAQIAAIPIAADPRAVAAIIRRVPGMGPRASDGVAAAMAIGSQNVRQRLIDDIDRVLPDLTPAGARQWLDEALPACEAWLTRLQALFPRP